MLKLDITLKRRQTILKILNACVLVIYPIYIILYAIVDFHTLWPLIIVLSITSLLFIASIYYNTRGNVEISKNISGYTLTITLITICYLIGVSHGLQNFFLLYVLLAIVIVPLRQKIDLLMMISINLASYVYFEYFFNPQEIIIEFPEAYSPKFDQFVLLQLILTTGIVIFYYHSINEKYETIAVNQTKDLQKLNTRLQYQTTKLNELNTLMEERQQQIKEQAEHLNYQNESLHDANNELEKLVSTKDKFFSIIAHDLKNPIGSIMGFSQYISSKDDSLPAESKVVFAQSISESATKTYNLLEDLLEWARSQNSQLQINPVNVNINELVQTNINLLKGNADEKNLSIIFEPDNRQQPVTCDLNMIKTVIRNLLNNAIKFTPHKGEIKISVKPIDPGNIEVSIADTGVGIPANQLEYLFRIDKSYTTDGTSGEKGNGLGLILCKEFVEKNGGSLSVKSTEGKGSVFAFTLPVSS